MLRRFLDNLYNAIFLSSFGQHNKDNTFFGQFFEIVVIFKWWQNRVPLLKK